MPEKGNLERGGEMDAADVLESLWENNSGESGNGFYFSEVECVGLVEEVDGFSISVTGSQPCC